MCDARSMSITSIRRHSRLDIHLDYDNGGGDDDGDHDNTTLQRTCKQKRHSSCFKSFTIAFGA